MNVNEMVINRLLNQNIEKPAFKRAKDIVSHMGAIQSQDPMMAKFAVGLRTTGSTEQIVDSEINDGDIIRTHVLRPTWHFVSSDDVNWMLDLSSPQIKAAMRSREKELGLTDVLLARCFRIIENTFKDKKEMTREELTEGFEKIKIDSGDNRFAHILMRAELEKIICSGKIKGNKQTYSAFSEHVKKTGSMKPDEALYELAKRYITSRGPVTLRDFIWWSGLSSADAKKAFESAKSFYSCEVFNGQIFLFSARQSAEPYDKKDIFLLPAYDEYLLSYKDRTSMLPPEMSKRAVSDNGIFRPVIVINGIVCGTWKKNIIKNKVIIETDFFKMPDGSLIEKIKHKAMEFGKFLNKEVYLRSSSK